MTKLQFLRQALVTFLETRKVPVLPDFPKEARKRYGKPVVVASVRELSSEAAGFQNYLGERYDPQLMCWEERFGVQTKVCFSLDVYSPRDCGPEGLRELMDQLEEAFSQGAPAGLAVRELSWGKTNYDRSCDMFRAEGKADCEGLLYSVASSDGSFLSFEVKGGIIIE